MPARSVPPPPPPPRSAQPDSQAPRLQQRIAELTGKLTAARNERDKLKKSVHELEANQRQAQAALAASGQKPNPLAARVAELEAKLKLALQRAPREAPARVPTDTPATDGREVDALKSRVRELEAKLEAVERRPVTNDLKRIRGIGPAFERALAAAGVTAWVQIASWDPADVERIAEVLNISPTRIVAGQWTEQAKDLAQTDAGR